jgi:uncharacterized protein (DUF1330 family)
MSASDPKRTLARLARRGGCALLISNQPITYYRIGPAIRPKPKEVDYMRKLLCLGAAAILCLVPFIISPFARSAAAQQERPAFVIVERTLTTGSEAIQQEYAKLARDILPKYGTRYLARSQENTLLEGDGEVPCCMAILEFPNMDAVRRWYGSPENQEASKVRQSGAKFRIIAIQGLPPVN